MIYLVNLANHVNPLKPALRHHGLPNLLERTMQHVILTRDAESHVIIMRITIRKSAARHARNTLAYQHLVKIDRVCKSFRDARPNVKRRTRVVNREARLDQGVDCCLSLLRELIS